MRTLRNLITGSETRRRRSIFVDSFAVGVNRQQDVKPVVEFAHHVRQPALAHLFRVLYRCARIRSLGFEIEINLSDLFFLQIGTNDKHYFVCTLLHLTLSFKNSVSTVRGSEWVRLAAILLISIRYRGRYSKLFPRFAAYAEPSRNAYSVSSF